MSFKENKTKDNTEKKNVLNFFKRNLSQIVGY